MFRLLIVDDEPIIVEGIFELLNDKNDLELDLYKAYSGAEALEIIKNKKMDIVLTDINMPGINGLELIEKIFENWVDCKIILLSGHREFDYVYKAIKYEGVSYLLKAEGYDKILETVEKNIINLKNSLNDNEVLERARQQIGLLIPLLQKEYIMSLLSGENVEINKRQFLELDIKLNPQMPVWAVVGSMDRHMDNITSKEKLSYFYTINAVCEKYIDKGIVMHQTFCENQYLVWLLQPKSLGEDGISNYYIKSSEESNRLNIAIRTSLETIQKATKELIGKTASFVYTKQLCKWDNLEEKYSLLKLLLNYRSHMGNELILTDEVNEEGAYTNINMEHLSQSIRIQLKKIDNLEIYLKNGQKEEFFVLLKSTIDVLRQKCQANHNLVLETYYHISLFFISYLNQYNLTEKAALKINISKLFLVNEFTGWENIEDYINQLSNIIFDLQKSLHEQKAKNVVTKIRDYILQHLSEELSLVKLAELVYFNPKYLSRLFKQSTGENLTDYIKSVKMEKSKELLKRKDYKIHEVAAEVGFFSAPYFTKFFKKETNMSPQEYRDSQLN